jgi:hypothetical protein
MKDSATQVYGIEKLRDGGTILFSISGSKIDGSYRLQTPFRGTPCPLFRDGKQLDLNSTEEQSVAALLSEWYTTIGVPEWIACKKIQIPVGPDRDKNLPDGIALNRIRYVIEKLNDPGRRQNSE